MIKYLLFLILSTMSEVMPNYRYITDFANLSNSGYSFCDKSELYNIEYNEIDSQTTNIHQVKIIFNTWNKNILDDKSYGAFEYTVSLDHSDTYILENKTQFGNIENQIFIVQFSFENYFYINVLVEDDYATVKIFSYNAGFYNAGLISQKQFAIKTKTSVGGGTFAYIFDSINSLSVFLEKKLILDDDKVYSLKRLQSDLFPIAILLFIIFLLVFGLLNDILYTKSQSNTSFSDIMTNAFLMFVIFGTFYNLGIISDLLIFAIKSIIYLISYIYAYIFFNNRLDFDIMDESYGMMTSSVAIIANLDSSLLFLLSLNLCINVFFAVLTIIISIYFLPMAFILSVIGYYRDLINQIWNKIMSAVMFIILHNAFYILFFYLISYMISGQDLLFDAITSHAFSLFDHIKDSLKQNICR